MDAQEMRLNVENGWRELKRDHKEKLEEESKNPNVTSKYERGFHLPRYQSYISLSLTTSKPSAISSRSPTVRNSSSGMNSLFPVATKISISHPLVMISYKSLIVADVGITASKGIL
jgi:hypothetical protein